MLEHLRGETPATHPNPNSIILTLPRYMLAFLFLFDRSFAIIITRGPLCPPFASVGSSPRPPDALDRVQPSFTSPGLVSGSAGLASSSLSRNAIWASMTKPIRGPLRI